MRYSRVCECGGGGPGGSLSGSGAGTYARHSASIDRRAAPRLWVPHPCVGQSARARLAAQDRRPRHSADVERSTRKRRLWTFRGARAGIACQSVADSSGPAVHAPLLSRSARRVGPDVPGSAVKYGVVRPCQPRVGAGHPASRRRPPGDDRAAHGTATAHAHMRRLGGRDLLAGGPARTPRRLRAKYRG
jgi:hypothetical protein